MFHISRFENDEFNTQLHCFIFGNSSPKVAKHSASLHVIHHPIFTFSSHPSNHPQSDMFEQPIEAGPDGTCLIASSSFGASGIGSLLTSLLPPLCRPSIILWAINIKYIGLLCIQLCTDPFNIIHFDYCVVDIVHCDNK